MWLEGFLHGNALLIIYQPAFWEMLNDWVAQLALPELYESLPVLRRTFAKFSAQEREQLLQMAQQGRVRSGITPLSLDEAKVSRLKPALLSVLNE